MRVTALGLVLVVVAWSGHAQIRDYEGYTREELEGKVQSFSVMQASGVVLMTGGIVSLVAGIVNLANSDAQTSSYPGGVTVSATDSQGAAGIILLAAGIPFTAAGTVLTAIGSRKRKEYKIRLRTFGGYRPDTREVFAGVMVDF